MQLFDCAVRFLHFGSLRGGGFVQVQLLECTFVGESNGTSLAAMADFASDLHVLGWLKL
jgi:hypothetical protein